LLYKILIIIIAVSFEILFVYWFKRIWVKKKFRVANALNDRQKIGRPKKLLEAKHRLKINISSVTKSKKNTNNGNVELGI